ncbi:13_t:CDS:2 [Ambispora gerdemannii]|uniref:13_t:CDS:1 n=1 Tax=Ambispora gerdemannii TaxID=144530 RepID=A0A9N9A5S5_9GLOM|nr:13_t:CDS:2 [Ambispora gerdemannii]
MIHSTTNILNNNNSMCVNDNNCQQTIAWLKSLETRKPTVPTYPLQTLFNTKKSLSSNILNTEPFECEKDTLTFSKLPETNIHEEKKSWSNIPNDDDHLFDDDENKPTPQNDDLEKNSKNCSTNLESSQLLLLEPCWSPSNETVIGLFDDEEADNEYTDNYSDIDDDEEDDEKSYLLWDTDSECSDTTTINDFDEEKEMLDDVVFYADDFLDNFIDNATLSAENGDDEFKQQLKEKKSNNFDSEDFYKQKSYFDWDSDPEEDDDESTLLDDDEKDAEKPTIESFDDAIYYANEILKRF